MKLEIKSIADGGDPLKERIILRALADLDVGQFAVFKSGVGSSGKEPTSGRKAAYWFPDGWIKAGDRVVLYTKKGSRSTKQMDDGYTAHFFYWGREDAMWGDRKSGAVLLGISDWQFELPY